MNPSFLFDIICTAVWIGLAIHYARKGMLAAVGPDRRQPAEPDRGPPAGRPGARGALFDRFFAGSFRERIAANLSAGGAVDLNVIAQRYAGFLPESFRQQVVEACSGRWTAC